MNRIPIAHLKPGDRFNKPVFIDKNNLFLKAGEAIKAEDLEKLRKWGVEYIYTSGVPIEPLSDEGVAEEPNDPEQKKEIAEVIERYQNFYEKKSVLRSELNQLVDRYQSVVKDILNERLYNVNPIREISEELLSYAKQYPYFPLLFDLSARNLANHSLYVTWYTLQFARSLRYNEPRLIDIGIASLLADLGMYRIPPHILNKIGALTPEEKRMVEIHPIVGYKTIIEKARIRASYATIAINHHENFDGTGYPKKIKQHEIPEESRIFQICDRFVAMISERPHRKPMLPYEALKTLLSSEIHTIDPILLKSFIQLFSIYPPPSCVELGSHKIAVVLENNQKIKNPLRPILLLLKNEHGEAYSKAHILDLNHIPTEFISKAIPPSKYRLEPIHEHLPKPH